MLWVVVFAVALWRTEGIATQANLGGRPPQAQLPQLGPVSAHFRPSG